MLTVTEDQWSPLFADLQERLSAENRRIMLSKLIGSILDVTQRNIGYSGIDRPFEWAALSTEYALEMHDGDTTPTLFLPEEKHQQIHPGEPHMIDNFRVDLGTAAATLTNLSEYASEHQEGKGAMYRPFFPVNTDGSLTPNMVIRLQGVFVSHFTPA